MRLRRTANKDLAPTVFNLKCWTSWVGYVGRPWCARKYMVVELLHSVRSVGHRPCGLETVVWQIILRCVCPSAATFSAPRQVAERTKSVADYPTVQNCYNDKLANDVNTISNFNRMEFRWTPRIMASVDGTTVFSTYNSELLVLESHLALKDKSA